jgi:hypothetical protein
VAVVMDQILTGHHDPVEFTEDQAPVQKLAAEGSDDVVLAENPIRPGHPACWYSLRDSAEALVSSYIQPGDLVGIADRRGAAAGTVGRSRGPGEAGARCKRLRTHAGCISGAVGSRSGSVEEFTAANPYPPFHDRVRLRRQLHPMAMIGTDVCG